MREYIISVGSVMTLVSFALLLIPEGGVKKFASLAAGFMIISAILEPNFGEIDISKINVESYEIDISKEEALYKAEVIKKHQENLKNAIEKEMKHNSQAYVETDSEGNITKVSLKCGGDESRAVLYITETLGVPRERIFISYENN